MTGLDEADDQKWILTHIGSGYYSIISKASQLALTVQADYLNTANKAIVQTAYTGLDSQKWKIDLSSSGAYIIRPKSGESYATDWCMSAGSSLGGSNGQDVEQRVYTSDSDYKDEWYMLLVEPNMTQITLANGSTIKTEDLHSFIFENYARNANIRTECITAITKTAFIEKITDTGCVSIITHGGEAENKLWISPTEVLYLSELDTIPSSEFDGVQLIVLSACCSGRPGGESFVDLLYAKGVDIVIGFEGKIEQTLALFWTQEFHKYLSLGNTVANALVLADDSLRSEYGNTIYLSEIPFITDGRYCLAQNLDIVLFS